MESASMLQSRTTDAHVWQPPSPSGTVCENRAERWSKLKGGQGQQDGQAEKPAMRRRVSIEVSPPQRSPSRSPTPQRAAWKRADSPPKSPGASEGSSRRSQSPLRHQSSASAFSSRPVSSCLRRQPSPSKAAAGSPPRSAGAPRKQVFDEAHFQADWFEGMSGHQPAKGGLAAYTTNTKEKPGMSHPPQNPRVQQALISYLKECKVPPRARGSRTIADGPVSGEFEQSSGKEINGRRALFGQNVITPVDQAELVAKYAPEQELHRVTRDVKSAPHRARMASLGGSTTSLSIKDARGSRKRSPSDLWLFPRQQDMKAPLVPADTEFHRWTNELVRKSRGHGFLINRKGADDLADLAIYHNRVSRSAVTRIASPRQASAEQLRSLTSALKRVQNGGDANRKASTTGNWKKPGSEASIAFLKQLSRKGLSTGS
eukprot:TRINITY_DN28110_c1_g1_i1.p1 TRINITY_DN28110_c1_g1~~TRINITY_DN28110_c1_g1_i1.p1  ORF type:complete len:447 (-),score=61.77 TRINITY_DN28110_c1_g1_i1:51-1340(-)